MVKLTHLLLLLLNKGCWIKIGVYLQKKTLFLFYGIKLTAEGQKLKILSTDLIAPIMQGILGHENIIDRDREHYWVIGLSNRNNILLIELISLVPRLQHWLNLWRFSDWL